jgi:hypothetical protein
MTPDSQKTVLRSRPQATNFGATAGQEAVTREAAACRNHLVTRYPGFGDGIQAPGKAFRAKVPSGRLLVHLGRDGVIPVEPRGIAGETRRVVSSMPDG